MDATYEIPLCFRVTKASCSELKQLIPLLEDHQHRHPEVGKRCKTLAADRGYDDTQTLRQLYDDYKVKPVIDIRNCWQAGGDEVARVAGQPVTRQLYPYQADNIVYDYKGGIYCICLSSFALQSMSFDGFEKDSHPVVPESKNIHAYCSIQLQMGT